MFKEISKKLDWENKELIISTGKIARQASGSVMLKYGNTVILSTVTVGNIIENPAFLPLTVHYREMFSAAGKIPGGFIKREGKPSDNEILTSRLIDRSIRPTMPKNLNREVQVICTVLSYDQDCPPSTLAIIATSAALAISGIPILDIVAATKIGLVDKNFIVNPTIKQQEKTLLDLVVSSTDNNIIMLESKAKNLSEEEILTAISLAQEKTLPVINMIKDFRKEVGREILSFVDQDNSMKEHIESNYKSEIENALKIADRNDRNDKIKLLLEKITNACEDEEKKKLVKSDFENVLFGRMRSNLISTKKRIDGRNFSDIRDINSEIGFLPGAHGSALFTRGETQALATITLGHEGDQQIVEGLAGETKESFYLQYIFPPYSVGETGRFMGPGRREIGHGMLARKAVENSLPNKEKFPYTIRVISEITESNGSSSMATVCATILALMDAGVPIKNMVAGIAMGLIKDKDDYHILSDIAGDEDFSGDMDFKVSGTEDKITVLQMDTKIIAVNFEMIKEALKQAREGIVHILDKMKMTIDKPKEELSANAPLIETFNVDKSQIRSVIGQGGKTIRGICDSTDTKIDINDDGLVSVFGNNKDSVIKAKDQILEIVKIPQIGDIFTGKVVKILDSGAFIQLTETKEGYLHISQISDQHVDNINDHLKEGKSVKVKVVSFDRGKAKLTMNLDSNITSERPRRRTFNRDSSGGRDSGNRRHSGGGNRDYDRSDSRNRDSDSRNRDSDNRNRRPRRSNSDNVTTEKKYFR